MVLHACAETRLLIAMFRCTQDDPLDQFPLCSHIVANRFNGSQNLNSKNYRTRTVI